MTRKEQLEWLARQPDESTPEEREAFESLERERLKSRFLEREARELKHYQQPTETNPC